VGLSAAVLPSTRIYRENRKKKGAVYAQRRHFDKITVNWPVGWFLFGRLCAESVSGVNERVAK
jgi:hypothetical protein